MQSSTIVQEKRGQITGQAMQFGLMFFSSGESAAGQNKYHLLLESLPINTDFLVFGCLRDTLRLWGVSTLIQQWCRQR